MTNTSPPKNQRYAAPAILSILIHIAALFGLLFWHIPTPKPPPVGIQTTFFGQDELAQVQSQIQKNAQDRLAQSTAAESTPAPSDTEARIRAVNEAFAQRQAEFDQEMAKFNAELQALANQEQQNHIDTLKAQQKQDQ